jgi:uncharacterized membrane protein
METPANSPVPAPTDHPFQHAIIRGLGALVPPLFSVLIIVWVVRTTDQYVLEPVVYWAREALVSQLADIREDLPVTEADGRTAVVDNQEYYRLADGHYVPLNVYRRVQKSPGSDQLPQTAVAVYRRYVELNYLRPYYVIPAFLAIFILGLYLLGRFMAAGIGSFFWTRIESGINRLPLVRSVYSAVKQVSDFFFKEQEVKFTRVVAVEYPRRGMWIMAFVTREGLPDVRAAVNEPTLGIFIPTSPLAMSGYAFTVLKREVIDLNISVDQAVQFIVSCGLVIPNHDVPKKELEVRS